MAIKLSLNKTLYSYDGQLEAYVTDTTVVKVQIHTDYNLSDSVLVYKQGDVQDSVAIINNVAEIPGMNLRSGQLSVAVLYDNTLSNFVQIYITKAAALSQNLVDDDPYFTVDRNKRLVSVPGTQDMIAVNFDENSEVITFKFPRYADGVDLSTKEIYVNYERSDKTRNKALCTLTDTSDSYVVFTWVVSAYATQVEGILNFNIEFRSVDYRWQTQPTSLLVYRSLLYTGEALPDQPELLDQYLDMFAELNSHPPIPGDDGYWQIWSLDTHSYETSEFPLKAGKDGKSAYAYAVEGGYTGTETEFAEKLAQEQLSGTTFTLTPTQVYEAVSAGIPVKVQYTDSTYGVLSFTAFNVAESLNKVVSQTIVYYNYMFIVAELTGDKSSNRWSFIAKALAQKTDIPSALPNPNALTITSGSNSVTYDGSTAESINIPNAADAMGLSGLAADDQIMVSAVDTNGKPTSWKKKWKDVFNIRDLGAKGDGVTDDTAVFQTALSNCRRVFVPGGVYVLSDEITLTISFTTRCRHTISER
jgi:hypothetical protein